MKNIVSSYRFAIGHLLTIYLKCVQELAIRVAWEQEEYLSWRISVGNIGTVVLLLTGAPLALAQSSPQPAQDGMLKNGPPVWDANHDSVYTCDEWKSFADRIITSADRNRDGHLDPSEFATVQKADATLADADFGYFDENQDGKITRKEFVEKPSAFILRFDRNGDCRVTPDEIRAAVTPNGPQGPPERPRDRFH
jgi:EF hand